MEPQLTKRQQDFLSAINEGKNIFLTGKAGTGKSYIVKEAIDRLRESGKKFAAVAPTGIAANNIDGQTIHSLFQLNPYGVASFEDCNFLKSEKRDVLRNIEVVFIDEVSMLRPDVLDGMHWTLKKNGIDGLDKKQIIFIGDMMQLPPIVDDNTRSVLYETYDGDTFDFSKIYQKIKPETIELDEVLRQTNQEFIDNLNIVREGGKSEYFKKFIHTETSGVILAPYNATVEMYNKAGLESQIGEQLIFEADLQGNAKANDFHLEKTIKVKNGCKIMYLVNSKDNPLRNGTIGTFVSHSGCHYIRVNDTDFALQRIELSKKNYVYNKWKDKIELVNVGSITQYPFKLAYAISIHKAQGLTFDDVTIDFRRPPFQKGQSYVALSRVRTPEGLRIIM